MRPLLTICCLFLSLCALARGGKTTHKGADDFLRQVETIKVPDSIKEMFNGAAHEDTALTRMHKAVFWYTFEQNKKVFEWQYISSIIIFCMVMLVVICGLYMSYMQFKLATSRLTKTAKSGGKLDDDTKRLLDADMELGKDGIKIKTAVVGLVILVISLAFLFLYLKYVYPISIVKIA